MPELSDQDIDRLNDLGKMVKQISGDGVTNDGQTIRIKQLQGKDTPQRGDLWRWVRLTSKATGAGLYNARLQIPKPTAPNQDPTADFVATTFYTDLGTAEDCIFRNLFESGAAAGTHALTVDGTLFVLARLAPVPTTDSPPKPVFELTLPVGMFPVMLVSDGGADGSNTGPVASTLTYTLKSPDGTTTIKTGVSVWMARQKGHVTAATKGFAQSIGGTLYVVAHDEVLDAMNC